MRRHDFICLSILLVAIIGCKDAPTATTSKHSREVMGTFAEVTAVASDEHTARAAVEAAYVRLDDVNRLMSDYIDDSEIGQLNQLPADRALTVSPETFFVLQQADEFSRATGGVFDITCRPLVELWRQAGQNNRLPSDELLTQTLARVGWQKLRLDPEARSITKTAEGMQIDVGGIAKGYALDLAAAAMKKTGATGGLIDVGGDVLAFGSQAGGLPWRIGVQHPFEAGLICKLSLVDLAVATSGNQQRYNVIAGERYSHIIDPRTGQPADEAPSVTVIAPDGITADVWATVFSVLSVAEGRERANHLENVKVMWIWGTANDPRIETSAGFDQYLIQ